MGPPEAGGFPKVSGIQWEFKEGRTVVEAWHAPEAGRNRAGKRYLGRFGKRRTEELLGLPFDSRLHEIRSQLESWRRGKGIE